MGHAERPGAVTAGVPPTMSWRAGGGAWLRKGPLWFILSAELNLVSTVTIFFLSEYQILFPRSIMPVLLVAVTHPSSTNAALLLHVRHCITTLVVCTRSLLSTPP